MGNKIFGFVSTFVIYLVVIGILYLFDNYAGFLMNLIFLGMIASVLVISSISEVIQKSKVTRIYFWSLAGAICAGILCVLLLQYDLTQ